MLPPISAITSIEMIRDGGSLQAGFLGTNGSKYCLRLPLISERTASGEIVRQGYAQPIVFERLEIRREKHFEWHAINQTEVSWEHAKTILQKLRTFVQRDKDAQWLLTMEEVVNTQGKIPHDIPRTLGPAPGISNSTETKEG